MVLISFIWRFSVNPQWLNGINSIIYLKHKPSNLFNGTMLIWLFKFHFKTMHPCICPSIHPSIHALLYSFVGFLGAKGGVQMEKVPGHHRPSIKERLSLHMSPKMPRVKPKERINADIWKPCKLHMKGAPRGFNPEVLTTALLWRLLFEVLLWNICILYISIDGKQRSG